MLRPASALPPFRLANNARRRRPLISLTPLIDVVFILLVFFMLTSTFLDWRPIELNAPGPTVTTTASSAAVSVAAAARHSAIIGAIRSAWPRIIGSESAARSPASSTTAAAHALAAQSKTSRRMKRFFSPDVGRAATGRTVTERPFANKFPDRRRGGIFRKCDTKPEPKRGICLTKNR